MSCEVCFRELPLTKHHLIPVTRHKNKKTKKRHSKESMNEVIMVCRQCHNQLHALICEKDMDETYNTLDRLLTHEGVRKFAEWIRKRQPDKRIRVKCSKERRRRR